MQYGVRLYFQIHKFNAFQTFEDSEGTLPFLLWKLVELHTLPAPTAETEK